MKYKSVIFDMDGTVLDTLGDLLGAMNHAMAEHGFKAHTLEEMRSFVGDGLYMMAVRALPESADKKLIDSVFQSFKAYYNDHLNIRTKPYDGIPELLKKLKETGIKTAVSSNKYDAGAKMLSDIHFGDLIDMTVGESELVPKKPDPTGTFLIMDTLGCDRESTLYVGDSGVDIQTARNAGLPMVAVCWGFRTRQQLEAAGASRFAETVRELESHILN
ncbi:MAG: HAD family hydrolase [Clostridia bacterium]|nr:HAD family hydrolase [Clostridia bacterium]